MKTLIRALTASLMLLAAIPASAAGLQPTMHGDFGHYTFALTWQPGICNTGEHCLSNQPRTPLIGLHGLWASRPRPLIQKGVGNPIWWSQGCSYYGGKPAPLHLKPQLRATVASLMPHFRQSLLVHEYQKHVACFGFDPNTFFSTELAMRHAVAASSFAKYLERNAGSSVDRSAVSAQFAKTFDTNQTTSLQLQCAKDASGRMVLTQFWITIKTAKVGAFPRSASLMNALQNQTTCPDRFLIPTWQNP